MTVRFFSTDTENSSGGSGVKINQVTKLNVVAPHETVIDIPFTSKFDKLPLEVLKIEGGDKGVVQTLCDFDNSDSSDFEDNKYVEFKDDVMKLKTDYELGTTHLYDNVYEFDFAEFNQFKKIMHIK